VDKIRIGGIMPNAHLALINVSAVPDRPGIAASILQGLGEHDINVQFIVQCIDQNRRDQVAFCVDRDDLPTASEVVSDIALRLEAGKVDAEPEVAVVSIFGPDFRERPGVAGTMFRALADYQINIKAISTSISTVSCVIDLAQLESGLDALRQTFELP
jgi:aspartate kinase